MKSILENINSIRRSAERALDEVGHIDQDLNRAYNIIDHFVSLNKLSMVEFSKRGEQLKTVMEDAEDFLTRR